MNIEKLVNLFQNTHNELQSRAARSVDIYLVVRNWLFGWYIVEFEQNGENRAEYGKKLITTLSERLKEKGIKGVSLTNLKQFRQFFETYRQISQALPDQSAIIGDSISQALPAELDKLPETMPNTIEYLSSRFVLGWTHYVTLMTVKNDEERRFYEIEAAENGWGYRELERQINSALFERLALSKNKEKVKELSEKGQIIEKPQEIGRAHV